MARAKLLGTHAIPSSNVAFAAALALALLAPLATPMRTALAAPSEPTGFWTGEINSPVPSTLRGGKIIHAAQLSKLLEAGDVVVIDVSSAPRRPDNLAPEAPWLPTVHQGIPGAMWLPGFGLGVLPDSVDAFFRARLEAATDNSISRPLVIYCHKRCWLSWNAAKRAISYGYLNVSWFPEGIEGWQTAGLSTIDLKPQPTPLETASSAP